jgi:hypothetical protein
LRKNNSIGSLVKVKPAIKNKCTHKKCRWCPLMDLSGTIYSTTTGEMFTSKMNISCHSSNVIYSITCKICEKQYVGQTKRRILDRFQGHFYNVKSAQEYLRTKDNPEPTKGREPKDAVGIHFPRSDHTGIQDMKIQILEFIRLPPKSVRSISLTLQVEKAWIHKLRCTAPHGLNIFD